MKVVLKNIASNIVRAIMKKATENVFVLLTIIYLPVRLTLFVLPVKENILLTAANPDMTKLEMNVFFMFTIIFARTATRKTIYGKIRL